MHRVLSHTRSRLIWRDARLQRAVSFQERRQIHCAIYDVSEKNSPTFTTSVHSFIHSFLITHNTAHKASAVYTDTLQIAKYSNTRGDQKVLQFIMVDEMYINFRYHKCYLQI